MLRRQVDSALVDARCGLARELHDAVSRTVAAAAVQADAALALAPVDPERALRAAEEVGNAVARAEDELRRLRSVLRNDTSESGQHPGIGVSWRPMILEARAAGLQIKGWIDPRIDQESVDPQAREVARQLVAEALTNAAKYAPGARVVVRLEWTPDGVEVSVVDREGGAVDARNRAPGTGFGLLSQAERVEALGGRFTTSRTADGFAVYALVPPNPAPREDAVV